MIIACLPAACTVGRDYQKPEVDAPSSWNNRGNSGPNAGPLDKKALNGWWRTFGDRQLNDLVDRAVSGNLSLKAAASRLLEARAQRGVAGGAQFPTLQVSGDSIRSEFSETSRTPFPTGTVYSGGFDSGWEVDLFGGLKREVEAADANVEAKMQDYGDVRVTLLAEVALNYTEVRAYQERLTAAEANLEAQQKTLDLVESNVSGGEASRLDLTQARSNLEATRSQLPALRIALSRAQNRLAVLLGKAPGALQRRFSGKNRATV